MRREIDRLMQALEDRTCISELIAADERAAGRRVIRPGDTLWLPADEWEPGTVCALKDGRARLVLLHAKKEGRGSLTRLLEALRRENIKPIIVSPTRELQATLARRGWRKVRNKDEWIAPASISMREGGMASETFEEIVERNLQAARDNPDNCPDQSGLDDGPWLPGQAPRKKPAPKSAFEIAEIRARAWETRRAKYGRFGHRGGRENE